MPDEVILRAFEVARAAGLRTWSFNMAGLPGETVEDLEATIALNGEAQPDFVRVSIFTAYPGTPIWTMQPVPCYDSSYLRDPDALPDELRGIYRQWLSSLDSEGRLWVTSSERESYHVLSDTDAQSAHEPDVK
jgi:radical SAM superfamily enzyme YgiQ (UPF0313 family)